MRRPRCYEEAVSEPPTAPLLDKGKARVEARTSMGGSSAWSARHMTLFAVPRRPSTHTPPSVGSTASSSSDSFNGALPCHAGRKLSAQLA